MYIIICITVKIGPREEQGRVIRHTTFELIKSDDYYKIQPLLHKTSALRSRNKSTVLSVHYCQYHECVNILC